MRDHIAYLKYVLKHKYYVLQACRKLGVPLPQALLHDLSKFMPCEWTPYVKCFYAPDGNKQYKESEAFNNAWNHHQKFNKHHWQYWLLRYDNGETYSLQMPEKYIREMVVDWKGTGRASTGKDDVLEWYEKNRGSMSLHNHTRSRVEMLLGYTPPYVAHIDNTPKPAPVDSSAPKLKTTLREALSEARNGGYANYYVMTKSAYIRAGTTIRNTPQFEPYTPGSEHEFMYVRSGGRINIILDQS